MNATTPTAEARAPADGLPAGGTVVVKVGGAAVQDPETAATVADGVASLRSRGVRPVLVHGGGPQVTEALEAVDEDPTFRDGLRVTPPEALEAAEAALAATGKRLAGALSSQGQPAVALSGRDGHLVRAEPRQGLGAVGAVTEVEADLLRFLTFNGLVPVLGPPAVDAGGEALNVNADEVASAASAALGARALVLLTDADGVQDGDGRVDHVSPAGLASLRDRAAHGGMVPKLHAAQAALEDGVDRVLVARADRPLPDLLAGTAPATTVAPEAPK